MSRQLLCAALLLVCARAAAQTSEVAPGGAGAGESGPAASAPAQAARRDEQPAGEQQALGVSQVVSLAREHNPALKAALLEFESARWDVFGNEALYEPVLQLDATGSQVVTANASSRSVRINRVRRGEAGVELRKRLIWGADISLRLSTSVQKSAVTGGLAAIPTMTASGMMLDPSFTAFFGFGNFGPLYGLSARLSLKQPLWRGRGRDVGEASLREARAQQRSVEYARDRISSELLRDALTAYWELWYADATVAIQLQSQAVAAKQRDQAAARARSGSLAPAEVLSFETQVATREEDVLSARTEREARVHDLARLLGQNESATAYGVLSEPLLEERSFSREAVEREALAESAELRERSAALELARLRAKTAEDPSKPRLDLEGYVQTQGLGNESYSDAADMFVSGDVVSALLSLTYEAPLRDRVRRAEAAKARIAVQVAEEQLREARQRVLSEVRAALDREAAGRQRVSLSEQTATIASRQLVAEQARYQTGSSTSLAVLEAEDKVRSAQLRLARARADHAESVLVLEHVTGGLLARYAR